MAVSPLAHHPLELDCASCGARFLVRPSAETFEGRSITCMRCEAPIEVPSYDATQGWKKISHDAIFHRFATSPSPAALPSPEVQTSQSPPSSSSSRFAFSSVPVITPEREGERERGARLAMASRAPLSLSPHVEDDETEDALDGAVEELLESALQLAIGNEREAEHDSTSLSSPYEPPLTPKRAESDLFVDVSFEIPVSEMHDHSRLIELDDFEHDDFEHEDEDEEELFPESTLSHLLSHEDAPINVFSEPQIEQVDHEPLVVDPPPEIEEEISDEIELDEEISGETPEPIDEVFSPAESSLGDAPSPEISQVYPPSSRPEIGGDTRWSLPSPRRLLGYLLFLLIGLGGGLVSTWWSMAKEPSPCGGDLRPRDRTSAPATCRIGGKSRRSNGGDLPSRRARFTYGLARSLPS